MAEETSTSTAPTYDADLLKQVREQVEFYFSDSNYPTDRFMRSEASKSKDNFIDIDIMLRFNKLKSLTTDKAVVAASLAESSEVALNDDKTMIRRIAPLPTEDVVTPRSVYAKGLPEDSTLESVTAAFAEYGNIRSVRLRKRKDKTFEGSAFIEFDTPEVANEVAAKTVKMGEAELQLETKQAYHDRKASEKKEGSVLTKRKEPEPKDKEFTKGLLLRFEGAPAGTSFSVLKDFGKAHGDLKFVEFDEGTETSGFLRYAVAEDAAKALGALNEPPTKIEESVVTFSAVDGDAELQYWQRFWAKIAESGGGGGRKHQRKRRKRA